MELTEQQQRFISSYVTEIINGDAAIFAGAGLSATEGFVNWKDLLRDLAIEIKLDVDKEHDLIALAQYHFNTHKRGKINNKIKNEFTTLSKGGENHKVLARLGIITFWTTNYDKLIEKSLDEENKTVEIKMNNADFSSNIKKKDAIVYKMHGDKDSPDLAVLTKDDYETYNDKRELFSTALRGDLLSKTFLFIGFSFDDPNLDYILGRIKVLLKDNTPTHYCFFKAVSENDFKKFVGTDDEKKEAFLYAKIKQELKIQDLKRYGINAVMVDNYEEITLILKEVENRIKRKNIFISGAAHDYTPLNESTAGDLVHKLGYQLAEHGYKIVSGFGAGIGGTVINGALDYKMNSNYRNLDDLLILRPFPQRSNSSEIKKLWTTYRHEMIAHAGIAIFMFGNKMEDGKLALSDGMMEEFDICMQRHVLPIPIGCTGWVARQLWDTVISKMDQHYPNDPALKLAVTSLGADDLSTEAIIANIFSIITILQKL